MHTQAQPGPDIGLIDNLIKDFTWSPPLGLAADGYEDALAGPETITDAELTEAFENVEHEKTQTESGRIIDPDLALDGNEVLEGQVYNFDKLEAITTSSMPLGFAEEISALDRASSGNWNVKDLLALGGITFSIQVLVNP